MFDYRRTHHCGELTKQQIGKVVTLSGWVHKRRDLGNLIFIDLRDRFGMTQLIFDPNRNKELLSSATKLRSEWVISIQGTVVARAPGMNNPGMATGDIEVLVDELSILSESKVLPFNIYEDSIEVNEELRLKYRYLDIRKGKIANHLRLRHKGMLAVRTYLDSQGFTEIQTPIMSKSTPEGAREYLIPSRIHPGHFYSLPQSPQIYKQLLMIAGMDRYFQIAPCFRDEDLRAERQPEFTQIDMEMSFQTPTEIKKISEGLLKNLFKACLNIDIPTPFPELSYAYCMEHYGCDKPDLRFGMPLVRVDAIAAQSSFSVFLNELKAGGCIKGLCIKGGESISRKGIDQYSEFVGHLGLKGLAWVKKQKEGYSSSIAKFFSQDLLDALSETMEAKEGDLMLLAAGKDSTVNQSLDHLRRFIAKERQLIPKNSYKFLWVTDFPLFIWDAEEQRLSSAHHPFTSPHFEDLSLLDTEPLKVRSYAYDCVLNGYEVGGGSQRIHNQELQHKIFHLLQLTEQDIKNRMGFFIEALKYGTPPHLGIAFGFDRLMMILCDTENIKDVIAFPKTNQASDLMMSSPSLIVQKQLDELKIRSLAEEITLM
jgi:aspartyl-tRNA synthetase